MRLAPANTDPDPSEAWPAVPVWMWLVEQCDGEVVAEAQLSSEPGIDPIQVELPHKQGLLTHWYFALRASRGDRPEFTRIRSLVCWFWIDEENSETTACFSWQKRRGVRSTTILIPTDFEGVEVLRLAVDAAFQRLTGNNAKEAVRVLQEEHRRGATASAHQTSKGARAKGKVSKHTLKRTRDPDRRMVLPRLRTVSGGLPGLGRRG